MEYAQYYRQAKGTCGNVSWTMLVYYKLLSDMVSLAYVADMLLYAMTKLMPAVLQGAEPDVYAFYDGMMERMLSNAWGYILAIALGMLILFLWKGKTYWKTEIWQKTRNMTVGAFFCLLAFLVAVQAEVQLTTPILEWLLNQVGLSATSALESATMSADSLSMFLYAGFIGPFAEEIFFRGLILRTLRPYGKQAAILISSILFGLFHGNIVQIPYAFLVGLVLSYVTVEYSIFWAILLHVFNNFVLADLLTRLSELLPPGVGDAITMALIFGAAIAAVVIGICRRKEIREYFRVNPMNGTAFRAFVTSPGTWVFAALMLGSAAFMLML